MKAKVFFFITIILLINFTIAVELNIPQTEYQPRETLQGNIVGVFVSLSKDNIFIYQNGIPRPVPIISDLTKQDKIYYFYMTLPNVEGNYTLKIKNAEYYSSGELIKVDIIKNFTIKKSNRTSLSIIPGFIVARDDFDIIIKSIYGSNDIDAVFDLTGESKKFYLIEEDSRTVHFKLDNITTPKSVVRINNYEIPVFILKKSNNLTSNESGFIDLSFIPTEYESDAVSSADYTFKFVIENSGEVNLSNISLSNNFNGILSPNYLTLDSDKKTIINVTIFKEKLKENFSGEIYAKSNDLTFTLPVKINLVKSSNTSEIPVTKISCLELGTLCEIGFTCDGETTPSLEGTCCLSKCIEEKRSSQNDIWVGVLLLIFAIAIIAFFIWTNKRKQKKISKDDIIEERAKKIVDEIGSRSNRETKI